MISEASRKAREAFCSPSAAMTWGKGISLLDRSYGKLPACQRKTFIIQKHEKLPTNICYP
jgi:hypothetical protein